MTKVNVEVRGTKGGERQLLGTIDVPLYETITEAINAFEAEEAGKGEFNVLALINAQVRANMSNKFRVEQIRGTNVYKVLKDRASKSPDAAKKLAELLAELGIEGDIL